MGNNPLSYTDPLGLVEWRGTFNTKSLVIGVGFSVTNFDLTSDCVDGKTFNAKVVMVGPAGGLGLKALSFLATAQEDGTISFHDNSETIDPSRLEGGAGAISIGATVGKLSIEPGRIRIGRAFSDDVNATGLNIGAGLTLGSSTIVGGKGWVTCDCKN